MESALVVQQVCAGILSCGVTTNIATGFLFHDRVSISDVSRQNPLSWAPRGLWGNGVPGKSPLFGIFWFSIYFLVMCSAISLLAASFAGVTVSSSERADNLFNSCACATGSLFLAAAWGGVFTLGRKWALVFASVLLVGCALLSTTGAVLSKPLSREAVWFERLTAVSISLLGGWCCVAAGLGVGIVTRAYNRGLNAVETDEFSSVSWSPFPIVLAAIVGPIGVVFGNPIIPLPLAIATLFMPQLKKWYIWAATAIAVACSTGAVVTGLVYQSTDEFW